MSATLSTLAARGGVYEKLAYAVEGWNDRAEKRRVYRQTYRELAALTPREMSDLGLNRSMIGAVAYEAAYGPK